MSRAKSLVSRSSVVTQALKLNAAKVGHETYIELQALESQAVAAGATLEIAQAVQQAAQVKRDQVEKDLTVLNSACLVICKLRGVAAELFEEFDNGDPAGLAQHLEEPVSHVESIGPAMSKMLRHQLKLMEQSIEAVEQKSQSISRAQDELTAVLFKLEAGIASSRALLASRGVSVKFPTKPSTRTKKKGAEALMGAERLPELVIVPVPDNEPGGGSNGVVQPALTTAATGGEPAPS